MRLTPSRTPAFKRDVKRLEKKHRALEELVAVMNLVTENTSESNLVLRTRHNMHTLGGAWAGAHECHVANYGDWLLVWRVADDLAVFERTGTHDEIFRR